MKKNRIYADTSVFGGVFDPEFSIFSLRFFEEVREGKHVVLISEIVDRELSRAPLDVQRFFNQLPQWCIESILITEEMVQLRNAYIAAGVVTKQWTDDATQLPSPL